MANACRCYEFSVISIDDDNERTEIVAQTVFEQRRRDFFGFNRAKHAVLEAAILATRVHLLPADDLLAQICLLQPLVDKTAGAKEHEAFVFLRNYIEQHAGLAQQQHRELRK